MSKQRIYVDNAASTPLLPEVMEGIVDILSSHFANPSSIHAPGRKSRMIIEKARKLIAKHLHCSIGEIFITSGATEANNTILLGAVRDLGVEHIIYSSIEHPSVLKAITSLQQHFDIQVSELPVSDSGVVSTAALAQLILAAKNDHKKTLVSVMAVNNEIGTIQPLQEISQLCLENGVLFHTDAVQYIGKYKIDLEALPVSFMSASAHKFHGPKGIGFFYMNSENIIQPMIHGGAQERNMRSGTENTAYIHGMGIALDLSYKQLERRREYVSSLRSHFVEQIGSSIPSAEILGSSIVKEQQYCICNVSFAPHPRNEMMMMNLDVAGVSASGGSACSSGIEYTSHVMKAIGLDKERTVIRFSFSHMNTIEEIDIVINVLTQLSS